MLKISEGTFALGGLAVFAIWLFVALPFINGPPPGFAVPVGTSHSFPERSEGQAATKPDGSQAAPFFIRIPKTANEEVQEAKERDEKSSTDRWLMIFTGAVALFTLLLVGATILLYRAGEKQLLLSQRPWLGISSLKFVEPFKLVEGGAVTAVHIELKNAGHSPALKVAINTDLFLMKSGARINEFPIAFVRKLDAMVGFGGDAVFPSGCTTHGHSLTITANEIDECSVQLGEVKGIYPMIRVGVSYESDQGKKYLTMALYRMMGVRLDLDEFPADALQPTMWFCEAT